LDSYVAQKAYLQHGPDLSPESRQVKRFFRASSRMRKIISSVLYGLAELWQILNKIARVTFNGLLPLEVGQQKESLAGTLEPRKPNLFDRQVLA
jgi:hypothetical protein